MAKLSQLRTDTAAVNDGEWMLLGLEFDDVEIKIRGQTNAFIDAQSRRLQRAARAYGGEIGRIPIAVLRKHNAELLVEHLLVDVRNLTDDQGRAIGIDEFRDLLQRPEFGEVVVACYVASRAVGKMREEETEEVRGNSSPASATS
jgi:hypothetical protein